MKKILSVLLALLMLSAFALGISAASDAKTRLYDAAKSACPSRYRTYYMGIAYNILGQIDVTDTEADQIIEIIKANKSLLTDKGPSLDTYTSEEIKIAVDIFKDVCSILDITYDMTLATDSQHKGDVEFNLYYGGTWIATLDGDDFKPESSSRPSSSGVTPSYKVEFETSDGSSVTSIRVKKNGKIVKPEDPTKDGFVFDGWYSDEDCTIEFDFDKPITEKTKLYAKWTPVEVEPDDKDPEDTKVPDDSKEPDTSTWSNPYKDVNEDAWYYEAVEFVSTSGIMNGIDNETFAPDSGLTRGMFVTMLYRIAGSPKTSAKADFADVADGSWYEEAIAWAAENGIVKGISETEFAPDNYMTREQLATIIYRFAQFNGLTAVNASENLSFNDASSISEYAVSAMNWAAGLDIIRGYENGNIAPQDTTTRAQAAAILMRMSEKGLF